VITTKQTILIYLCIAPDVSAPETLYNTKPSNKPKATTTTAATAATAATEAHTDTAAAAATADASTTATTTATEYTWLRAGLGWGTTSTHDVTSGLGVDDDVIRAQAGHALHFL
jgi:hypothetical protein